MDEDQYSHVDIEHIREILIDYYGTAAVNGYPMAVMEISKVKNMNDPEIIHEAQRVGIIH